MQTHTQNHECTYPCSHADLHVHTIKHTHNRCCACKISLALRNSTNTSHPMWMHTYTQTHTPVNPYNGGNTNVKITSIFHHSAPPLFSITNSWGLHSLPLALPDVFTCLVLCNTLPYVRQNYPTWMLFSVGVIALVHSKLSERWMEIEGEVRGR